MAIGYATVKVNITAFVVDGIDSDDLPDDRPLTAKLTLTPMIQAGRTLQYVDGGEKKLKAVSSITVDIGADGSIDHQSRDFVKVIAPTIENSNLARLQWRARFSDIRLGGVTAGVVIDDIYFWVDPDVVVNVADHVNVAASTAVQIARGAQGFGVSSVFTNEDGDLVIGWESAEGVVESAPIPLAAVVSDGAVASLVADDGSATKTALDGMYVPVEPLDTDALMVYPRVLGVSKLTTPFNGIKVAASAGNFTPIWSDEDQIYIVQPVTVGSSEQTQAARLDKETGATLEVINIPASQHDQSLGHRNGSICVDRNGYVIQHGQSHNAAWHGRVGNAPQTLNPRSIIPDPDGGHTSSYRRFFRNPYIGAESGQRGDIWMVHRGDDYLARIYKWDEDTKEFEVRGPNPFSAIGAYGHGIAFGPGVVYCCPEFRSNPGTPQSGYPRRDIGLVKTYDEFATIQRMDGTVISGAVSPENITVIYPRRAGADVLDQSAHTAASSALVVASDGNPVVIGTWMNPAHDANYMGLYASKVDQYTGKIKRQRLFQPDPTWQSGVPQAAYTSDGWIVVIAAERHGNHPTLELGELDQDLPPTAVYLYTSRDGERFYRHELASRSGDDNEDAMTSANIDPESIRLDGTLRIFPQFLKAPSRSEIWTVTLPDPPNNLLMQATAAPPTPPDPGPTPTLEVVTSDDFTGVNGTISGRTSNAANGGTGFLYAVSDPGAYTLLDNRLNIPSPASTKTCTLPVNLTDGRITAILEPQSLTALASLTFRWQDASGGTGYLVRARRSGTADLIFELGVFVAGTFTALQTNTVVGVGWTGNAVTLDCVGSAIKAYINGGTTPFVSAVNGAVTTAGGAGFRNGNGAGAVVDNLLIERWVPAA